RAAVDLDWNLPGRAVVEGVVDAPRIAAAEELVQEVILVGLRAREGAVDEAEGVDEKRRPAAYDRQRAGVEALLGGAVVVDERARAEGRPRRGRAPVRAHGDGVEPARQVRQRQRRVGLLGGAVVPEQEIGPRRRAAVLG